MLSLVAEQSQRVAALEAEVRPETRSTILNRRAVLMHWFFTRGLLTFFFRVWVIYRNRGLMLSLVEQSQNSHSASRHWRLRYEPRYRTAACLNPRPLECRVLVCDRRV